MENKNLKPIPFKKNIKGRLILEIELPIEFKIDAVHEVYADEFGNQYYQDDYNYSVDQATSNMSTEAKAKLSEVLFQIRKAGFTINEYKIEEC